MKNRLTPVQYMELYTNNFRDIPGIDLDSLLNDKNPIWDYETWSKISTAIFEKHVSVFGCRDTKEAVLFDYPQHVALRNLLDHIDRGGNYYKDSPVGSGRFIHEEREEKLRTAIECHLLDDQDIERLTKYKTPEGDCHETSVDYKKISFEDFCHTLQVMIGSMQNIYPRIDKKINEINDYICKIIEGKKES